MTTSAFRDTTGESLPDAVNLSVSATLKHANFSLPGVVQSFDRAAARADVIPAVDQLLTQTDGTLRQVARPVIFDVPVIYPSGGGVSISFPLAEGDPVLLVFSQRGITEFKASLAADTSPANSRPDARVFFSHKDAVAIPGFTSGMSDVPASGLNIQTPALLINGAPAFGAYGPVIATADLFEGDVAAGTDPLAATGWMVVDTDWAGDGGDRLIDSGRVVYPPEACGIMVRTLDAQGEIERVLIPMGLAASNSQFDDTHEFRSLRHGRGGARFENTILVRTFASTGDPLFLECTTLSNGVTQTIAAGVSIEVRYWWNGGPA